MSAYQAQSCFEADHAEWGFGDRTHLLFRRPGSMPTGDHIDRAILEPGNAGLDMVGGSQGRIQLKAGMEVTHRLVGFGELIGTNAGRDANATHLSAAENINGAAARN